MKRILFVVLLLSLCISSVSASTEVWNGPVNVTGNFTQTLASAQVVKVVVQGNTSVDNIDQSLDSGWAATSVFVLGTSANETVLGWQDFTPTKKLITNISINCVATGTAATWTMIIHSSSNTTISSTTFTPVAGVNSVPVPEIWTSGGLHFHVYSSTTTGAPTLKASADNMNTASYIQYYAKNTEDVQVDVNGVRLNLTTASIQKISCNSMTSNTTSSGCEAGYTTNTSASADMSLYNAWKAFGGTTAFWAAPSASTQWVSQYIPFDQTITSYSMRVYSDASYAPNTWKLYGSNDRTNWEELDTRSGITWAGSDTKTYNISTSNGYRYYNISVSTNNGGVNTVIDEVTIYGYKPNADGLLSGAIVDTDKGTYNSTLDFDESSTLTSNDVLQASKIYDISPQGSPATGYPTILKGWNKGNALGYGSIDPTTVDQVTVDNFTLKYNTMLPVRNITLTSIMFTAGSSEKSISLSSDGITWTKIISLSGNTGSFVSSTSTTGNFAGNSTIYAKVEKDAVYGQFAFASLSFNATLNTTGLPTQSVIAGTNYYNISSNGRADSASLDPSMLVNVWLMGQGTVGPVASFTQNKTSGASPLAVLFTDTSTNRPKVRNWSVNSTDWATRTWYNDTVLENLYPTLTQTFVTTGIYNITLSVSNITEGATISTVQHDVRVNSTLQADFVGAPLTGYASTDVSFVDFSTGTDIYAWSWTFGDGGTSILKNPTHTYSTVGTFDVSLTVTAPDGTSTKTEPAYITMATALNPDTASTLSFQQGTNIISNLTGYTRTVQIANVVNASWINGTTLFDADHIRITSVTANTTAFASNTLPRYSINNVTGTITFNATNTSGFVAGTTPLSFMNIGMVYDRYSTGSTSAGWGTGLIGNSTYKVQFPVSTLTDAPLTYEWKTYSNFSISNAAPVSGVTVVSLTPSDNPQAADRFLWNFGDGTTFLDHNGTAVTHVYTSVGMPPSTYSTSLTAYLSANTSITNTTAYTISPVYPAEWVRANFTATPTLVGSAEVVSFIDRSEFQNTTATKIYNWTFGDGLFSSTVGNVQHVYTYYGIYTVKLNVSNIDPALGNSSLTRTDYIQVSVDNAGTTLNVLYPHEVQFSLVDTSGKSLPDVDVAVVMSNSTVGNTNWFTTLFGISTDATPVDSAVLTGTSDDDGSITFPLISSGRYTMSFNSTMRGISETKTVYPQQANYIFVLHPNANLIPNRNAYINGTLYVTTPNESYADLWFSYTDLSASTTSISFYVDYSNHTRFNTQTFAGVSTVSTFKSVPNVKATSYVWGYYANSSMFGNVSASQGIMMKGITGKLINLDPCGGYARGWGNQC